MKFKHRFFTLTLASLAVLASSSAMAGTLLSVFGDPATAAGPSQGNWVIDVNAPGTLAITLVRADYSELFDWTLSGPVNDWGTVYPSHPNSDGTGALHEPLGTWSAATGSYSFAGTSYTTPGSNFEIQISFDPSFVLIGQEGFEYVVVTPVSAVPVPAAVWLFGSGLLGLVGVARRKKAA